MKTFARIIVVGLVLGLGCFCTPTWARLEVSAGITINATADFYEPLGHSGTWVEVGTYGRCWRPRHVVHGWRPYCEGTWVWTDAGWYWESDEPWGWACYHYGSWYHDHHHGWVWVPDVEWAPAWVSWRIGGGHIGWAPCGPRGIVVAAPLFVFVEERRFHHRVRPNTVIVNNTTIINNTTVINNNNRRENRNFNGRSQTVVVNEGPRVEEVQKATGNNFSRRPVQELATKDEQRAPENLRRNRGNRDNNSPGNQGNDQSENRGDNRRENRGNDQQPAVQNEQTPTSREGRPDRERRTRSQDSQPANTPPVEQVAPEKRKAPAAEPDQSERRDRSRDNQRDRDRSSAPQPPANFTPAQSSPPDRERRTRTQDSEPAKAAALEQVAPRDPPRDREVPVPKADNKPEQRYRLRESYQEPEQNLAPTPPASRNERQTDRRGFRQQQRQQQQQTQPQGQAPQTRQKPAPSQPSAPPQGQGQGQPQPEDKGHGNDHDKRDRH